MDPTGEYYAERLRKFQKLMLREGIDASIVRTLSSFRYFTGIKWLRPALLVPAEGEPTAFVHESEIEEFRERTWIEDVRGYRKAEELVRGVTSAIREGKFSVVGFDYSVERDSYVLFFELFKKLNPQISVRDVHSLIMELRMVKDEHEIEWMVRAARIAEEGMAKALEAIGPGVREIDVAAEAAYAMLKMGSEDPHIYVNAGPRPRIHAEPRAEVVIEEGHAVNVTIGAEYRGYYVNVSRTAFVGSPSAEQERARRAFLRAYELVVRELRPGVKLLDVEEKVRRTFEEEGLANHYVTGFAHGVGLLIEEDPITTIVVPHRSYVVKEGMVLAAIHAPLPIPGVGVIKYEDTFVVKREGVESLTKLEA